MKPKIAVFSLTSCEGCSLQILNCEAEMSDLAAVLDFVNFREAMTEKSDYCDIAFIDGACSMDSEVEHLKEIRQHARMVVPIGNCACNGGLYYLKNAFPMEELLRTDYGDYADQYNTIPVRPLRAVVPIDYFVPGCPIVKEEFLRIVAELLVGRIPAQPGNPVCAECKMAGNVCVFDKGQTCLGPVTRGGCAATCVTGGAICWGCRGLIDKPNINAEKLILKQAGLTEEEIVKKFYLFNGGQEGVWK
jgi:coenzyme F420-reducing hydrogenase gamma subunit